MDVASQQRFFPVTRAGAYYAGLRPSAGAYLTPRSGLRYNMFLHFQLSNAKQTHALAVRPTRSLRTDVRCPWEFRRAHAARNPRDVHGALFQQLRFANPARGRFSPSQPVVQHGTVIVGALRTAEVGRRGAGRGREAWRTGNVAKQGNPVKQTTSEDSLSTGSMRILSIHSRIASDHTLRIHGEAVPLPSPPSPSPWPVGAVEEGKRERGRGRGKEASARGPLARGQAIRATPLGFGTSSELHWRDVSSSRRSCRNSVHLRPSADLRSEDSCGGDRAAAKGCEFESRESNGRLRDGLPLPRHRTKTALDYAGFEPRTPARAGGHRGRGRYLGRLVKWRAGRKKTPGHLLRTHRFAPLPRGSFGLRSEFVGPSRQNTKIERILYYVSEFSTGTSLVTKMAA
ncbi:Protein of unknown function [Gryllus bimaculatus]|nr:Protein of unknown function [Gryllus bimaculatus]